MLVRFILRVTATAAVAAGLLAGAPLAANAAPVGGPDRPAASPAIPACDTLGPPAGYYYDSRHSSCARCLDAGRALEGTGRWRAFCRYADITFTTTDLYRYCIACLRPEPVRVEENELETLLLRQASQAVGSS
jgi:hypothetical protein